MKNLYQVLNRLNQLDADCNSGSNHSRLIELASFMDDLPDIVQTFQQSLIQLEEAGVNTH